MNPSASESGVQARHLESLARGRFLIQHCPACDQHVYPPRTLCPHCGAGAPAWVEPSGLGTVYAVTTVRRRAEAGGDYNVSVIQLDEGVRLMSRVEGVPPVDVRIGLRVQARVRLEGDQALVVFDGIAAKARA